jgi:hypothetical protein
VERNVEDEEFFGPLGMRKQQSSARHLQGLYAIVAGLALTEAVSVLAREVDNGLPTARTLLMMTAFLATIIPFFHGGLRHLDDVYLISPPQREMSRFALPVDFLLLFLESVLVLGMAHRLTDPANLLAFLIFLLVVDIVWAIVTPLLIDRVTLVKTLQDSVPKLSFSSDTETAWAQNNILFLPLAIICWFALDNFDFSVTTSAIVISLFALMRTANDYRVSWLFYFPAPETAPAPASLQSG